MMSKVHESQLNAAKEKVEESLRLYQSLEGNTVIPFCEGKVFRFVFASHEVMYGFPCILFYMKSGVTNEEAEDMVYYLSNQLGFAPVEKPTSYCGTVWRSYKPIKGLNGIEFNLEFQVNRTVDTSIYVENKFEGVTYSCRI